MSDHTETPWVVEYRRGQAMLIPTTRKPPRGTAFVIAHVGQHAATDATIKRRDANADLIVRAVNNHDALVKALTDLLDDKDTTYAVRAARARSVLSALSIG